MNSRSERFSLKLSKPKTLVSVLKAFIGKWRKQGGLTESCGDLTFKKKLRDAMEDVKSGFHMRYLFCVNVF